MVITSLTKFLYTFSISVKISQRVFALRLALSPLHSLLFWLPMQIYANWPRCRWQLSAAQLLICCSHSVATVAAPPPSCSFLGVCVLTMLSASRKLPLLLRFACSRPNTHAHTHSLTHTQWAVVRWNQKRLLIWSYSPRFNIRKSTHRTCWLMLTHTHVLEYLSIHTYTHTFISKCNCVNISMRRWCQTPSLSSFWRRLPLSSSLPRLPHALFVLCCCSCCSSGALRAAEFVKFMLFAVAVCIICVFV